MMMFHPTMLLAAVGLLPSPDHHSVKAFAPSIVSTSLSSRVSTFTAASTSPSSHRAIHQHISRLHASRVTFADVVETNSDEIITFDPLGCSDGWDYDYSSPVPHCIDGTSSSSSPLPSKVAAPILALSTLALNPDISYAAAATKLSEGDYNPDSFRPVCAASDSFYRILQGSTRAVVGDESFSEYGPLIAGGLLRIRLELCVVESFFNEAVGPFIRENGLNWILPFHETVETFLAGTIFALATTFILVGSTKLIQIIAFYGDLIVGGPCRLFGGFFFDRARGEPVTLDVSFFGFFKTRLVGPAVDFKEEEIKKASGERAKILDLEKVKPTDVPLLALSGGVKVVGEASKIFREFIEGLDLFVGRYLVLIASGYIILKFIHFKVFPDFP
ncbi:hypothetical protein ACHAXR_008254 [Thalassiosira sp. AJA248-18]